MADFDEVMRRARKDYGKPLPVKKPEAKTPKAAAAAKAPAKSPAKAAAAAPKKAGSFRELGKALGDLSPSKEAMRQGMRAYVDRQRQAKELEKDL